ncbi:MFS transporter [Nostoc sp. FACHB-110]|uniref:MFS transporter n=1 Tax=Nostoc sp. FACHB-110 TaxID=2692834 RepID=UPI001685C142|nr:MFS transporter [Nostoc sp. FACHB-110]MBD2440529.1 MFS transporter [Nostoc sp. FACHB-110]
MKLLSLFKLNLDLPAWRSRNYRLYFAGQALSMTGNFMTQVAVLWLIYQLTDSALLLGIAGFFGQLPVFALAPISGILADRYNRHRLLLLFQIAGISVSVILTVITFLGLANFWTLLTLSTLLGLLKGLDVPVRHAFVSDMVNRELMANAIALNAAFLNGARLIGPALGGILIAKFGAGYCFLYDSLSYIVAIWAIAAMQITPRPVEIQTSDPWRKLQEGFQYAYHFLPVRSILLLLATASLVGMSYTTLLPIFAVEVLHGGSETLGFLTAAAAMGSVFACVYLSFRQNIVGLERLIAFCPAIMGVGFICFSVSQVFWISQLALVMVGWSSTLQVAASNTLLQFIVEDSKRGRVMSFYAMCFMGMAPFGNLLAGTLANYLKAPNTLILGGVICILGSLLFLQQLPQLAKLIHFRTNPVAN